MKLRVTFLITDLHRGGSPLMLAALAGGLKARGRVLPEVVSIAPLGEVADLLIGSGVDVSSLGARHRRDLRVVGRFVRHLREHRRPGVVCSVLIHANLLATLAKPFVERWGWIQSLHTLQERPRWHWYAQGVAGGFADAFVAPTEAIVKRLDAYGAMPRTRVIPNGVEVRRFREAVPVAQVPWPAGARVAGYVGRFDPVKRLGLVVRAVGGLVRLGWVDLHLVLVGYGQEEKQLRRLVAVEGLSGRVHFVGATREPERWYKRMGVMVSASAAEGFGLTLVEARAAGVPVVTCATKAVREVLGEDRGVVWMGSEPTVDEVMRGIEQGFGMMGKGTPGHVWTVEGMVERYEQLLLEVGAEKGLGGS